MATLEELLAEKERRQAAAPPTSEVIPEETAAPLDIQALLAEKARREQDQEFTFPTEFPEEAGTSQAAQELPEVAAVGAQEFLPEGQLPTNLGVTAAMMTTTDPSEIASMLQANNPEVGIQYAPDGTIIAANNKTGARAVINRPGISYTDVLQTLGLMSAFTPAARGVSFAKGIAGKMGLGSLGAGTTEAAIQKAQELAGGEFDKSDVALTAGLGAGAEAVGPVLQLAQKAKQSVGPLESFVPGNIMQALDFAKSQGKKVTSSDALKEFVTPPMQIFLKITERIPFFGTSKIGVRQQAERADTLSKIASEFDINVETELGEEIVDNFVKRMINKRFWGKKNPTEEQVRAAWQREGDEVTDNILNRYIRKGEIDDQLADKVLDSGRTKTIKEFYNRLDSSGKAAAKQRFIANGLKKSEWRPEAPQEADPTKFMEYLNSDSARKAANVLFSKKERELLSGTREYLRLTKGAGDKSGAGMTAAMTAGGGALGLAYLGGIFFTAVGGAATGIAGRIAQSDIARDLLLKLAHAKGNPKLTEKIMKELRPVIIAGGKQFLAEEEEPIDFDVQITKEMVKDKGERAYEGTMEYLRGVTGGS